MEGSDWAGMLRRSKNLSEQGGIVGEKDHCLFICFNNPCEGNKFGIYRAGFSTSMCIHFSWNELGLEEGVEQEEGVGRC